MGKNKNGQSKDAKNSASAKEYKAKADKTLEKSVSELPDEQTLIPTLS